ncbi:MAG: class 3 adenylate cyclase [Gammaproteobacteria bacterium]|jgi:class 3 adenylate cyclase
MKCPACQHDNEAAAVFCEECGSKLARGCASCGTELKSTAKFCLKCGTPTATIAPEPIPTRRVADYTPKHLADKILQSKSALEGERKQVTVLFADIQGSMELANQLDPERWHQLLERYFAILTDAVHRFEGTVNQYTGDGIMALFGAPIAHEDHAQRACYSALHARDELRTFADDLRLTQGLNFSFRIGLNSGDVVVGRIGDDLRMDYTAQGATVGIAQRIEQLAAPGHVYLSGATERLAGGYFQLRAMGETDLKGLAESFLVFELEAPGSARSRLDVAITRGLSRFVGRAAEMQTLEAALANAENGHGQVIGIVGEPGLGKSRLCFEFVERCRQQGLPVFEAHCPAHGKNIPYLPILELFRNYFEINADDNAAQARKKIAGTLTLLDPTLQQSLPVLFEFMGVGDPNHPLPLMDAEAKQRQLYELIHRNVNAQEQLTVTLIDDLHWVDPGSDGFVNQLVSAVEGRRALIVLNFRPEYVAAFGGKAHYQQLPLVPLGDAALRELLVDLIGDDDSVGGLASRIIEWTTGNPFYTEELVNALVESGDLAGRAGYYRLVTELDRLVVPTNVRAVLAARIDRLPDSAKRLLQTAAVIGREFSGPLLDAVSDATTSKYTPALERLMDGDFIYERALYPVFEYAFKHPLTHEVAYQSQLQSRRAVVHSTVALALEAQAGDKLGEQAALLAHHCEEAGELLSAARWHCRAAEWAGLNDFNAALFHWLRVRELVRHTKDESEATALLALACSKSLSFAWRVGSSAKDWLEIFEEGCAAAERVGDLTILAMTNALYGAVCGNNQGLPLEHVRYAKEAVRIADQTDDAALRVGTRGSLIFGYMYAGQLSELEGVADEIIALAAGDPHLGTNVIGFSPLMSALGVRPLAVGGLRDPVTALRESSLARQAAADCGYPEQALWAVAWEIELRYAFGISDGARALAQTASQLAENLGPVNEVVAATSQCEALLEEHEWQAVSTMTRDLIRRIHERGAGANWESRLLSVLARAQLELGDPEAARAAALKGVVFMRDSNSVWNPHGYAMLVRAQLELAEPAADISNTLNEYEALLTQTGFHIYEGELYELRARLAERQGKKKVRAEALARAHDCYNRFGMTAQAERIDCLQAEASVP